MKHIKLFQMNKWRRKLATVKSFTYTKDNGDVSERTAIVISQPRQNYLVYDVSKLTQDQIFNLLEALDEIDECRNHVIKIFEDMTGIKESTLWRSFKPDGIEWK